MYVMYMIWQVTLWNGQQRRPTIPTILVSLGEAITAAAITRAFASPTLLPTASFTLAFVHFYLCRSERLSRVINI